MIFEGKSATRGQIERVLHALDPRQPDVPLDYVASRKQIYVPDYVEMLKNGPHSATTQQCLRQAREHLLRGRDVVVYDFDGPRAPDGAPLCEKVTLQLLREKIDDPTFPFGHGYVVAAEILRCPPAAYAA